LSFVAPKEVEQQTREHGGDAQPSKPGLVPKQPAHNPNANPFDDAKTDALRFGGKSNAQFTP
jgi:hypothetical protein